MQALTELLGHTGVLTVAIAAAALLVLLVLVLVLWLRARGRAKRLGAELDEALDEAADLEVRIADQSNRLRIIRELHEVAVHAVTVVVSQAEGARYAGASDPQAAVRSLGTIAEAGRGALAELRRLAGMVRESEVGTMPQPRLKSVRQLFAAQREAGLHVRFEERGDRFPVSASAELAIFRILEEALANAVRHGGDGTEARVVFAWTATGLQVLVDDDGQRAAARRAGLDPDEIGQERGYTVEDDLAALTEEPAGRGIAEMRERAQAFGGVFTSYHVPGVGFSVSVVFPRLRQQAGGR